MLKRTKEIALLLAAVMLLMLAPVASAAGIDLAGIVKIGIGESTTWTAKVDAGDYVTWSAGNPGVAKVEKGAYSNVCKITGLKAGQCNITATTSSGAKKTVMMTVAAKVPLYTQDGRVIEVWSEDVEKNVRVGWSKNQSTLTIQNSGKIDDIFWQYGNGCMYVGGSGTVPAYFAIDTKPDISSLYVKRGVTNLEYEAFDGCYNLTHVELSDTVFSLGAFVFPFTKISRIGIPKSVIIDESAFSPYSYDDADLYGISNDNKQMAVYGERGSTAENFAKKYNLKFVSATCVYHPDGRTMMVSDAERPVYLRHGWYSVPVTTLYATDGRSCVCKLTDVAAYKAVNWHEKSEVYTTLYALDGRKLDFLNTKVEANRKVGWYYLEDYITTKADQLVKSSGYNAAVNFVEEMLYGNSAYRADMTYSQWEKVKAKLDSLYTNWQTVAGAPLIKMDESISKNDSRVPEVTFFIKNLSDKTVAAFEFEFTCYDVYGKETSDYSGRSGITTGYCDDADLAPRDTHWWTWTLNSNERTTNVKNVRFTKVAFTDGTIWTNK